MKHGHKSQRTRKAGVLAWAHAEVSAKTSHCAVCHLHHSRGVSLRILEPQTPQAGGVRADVPAEGQREGTCVGPGGPGGPGPAGMRREPQRVAHVSQGYYGHFVTCPLTSLHAGTAPTCHEKTYPFLLSAHGVCVGLWWDPWKDPGLRTLSSLLTVLPLGGPGTNSPVTRISPRAVVTRGKTNHQWLHHWAHGVSVPELAGAGG